MAKRKIKTTKVDIIRCATTMFLERGYSVSSMKQIADELDIGTGNLTYYFPTKEHLLAVLVDMLCRFQWKLIEEVANDGLDSLSAICLELAAMAVICEVDEAERDFYISSYTSPMCLEIIRRNDVARARKVFREYCCDWTDEQFAAAEVLVSGIEYTTLITVGEPVSLQTRIAGAMNLILQTYRIPEEIRKETIHRVLEMDYRATALRILSEFKQFVKETNEQTLLMQQTG